MRRYLDPYKLSPLQRAFLIPYFSIGGLLDPTKGDRIAGLGDVTSPAVLHRLRAQMTRTESGKRLLAEKPLLTEASLDVQRLRTLPPNTLGAAYVRYMDTHGFRADERDIVRFMDDPELAYVLVRYRQVHDFWHALSGLPPSVMGEVALKCFEYQVTGLPVCLISGVFGQLRLRPSEVASLWTTFIPWAIRAGDTAKPFLMSYEYEKNLDTPIEEVRKQLLFEEAPFLPYNP